MTRQFSKWAKKQNIPEGELFKAIEEVIDGSYEANLGGSLIKSVFGFRVRARVVAGEAFFVSKKMIEQFIFMVLPKIVNQTLVLKNYWC